VPRIWARQILDAYRANPDAVAIGGSVINGAILSAMDWASFLAVQTAQMSPIVAFSPDPSTLVPSIGAREEGRL
jgi:hypothetical protein